MEIREVKYYQQSIIDKTYNIIEKDLTQNYPNFKKWYYKKAIKGLENNTRKMYIATIEGKIAGVMILKCIKNKKICLLKVLNKYQKLGVGTIFIKIAQKELQDNYPMIIIKKSKMNIFKNLFNKFNFRISEYNNINDEIIYNKKEPLN